MTDPAFLTVPELGRLLRLRRLSAVELAGSLLDRLERLGPAYNAVVQVLREPALAEARERDAELGRGKDRGPLHGIPYGVKDLVSVAGGASAGPGPGGAGRPLRADATVVRRLRRAGAVLCARLAMTGSAVGRDSGDASGEAPGPGRNPWDPTRWSGGSSSGPGAAVAAGMVPFAIGSETWGSIQYPSAFCGVTGLRPTFGRVSRYGAIALSPTMDKLGPLARSAEDCGLVLAAVAGADPEDPTALAGRLKLPARTPARRYRIGVLRGTLDRTQAEVRRNFEASLEVLRAFTDIAEDLVLPDFPYDRMAGLVLDAEAASTFGQVAQSGAGGGLSVPEDRTGRSVLPVPARDYLATMRLRRKAAAALDRLLTGVDALAGPTLPTVAWPASLALDQAYPEFPGGPSVAGAANLCGVPGLFLMNGTGEAGLPTSLQLTGRSGTEATLLEIGMQFQARTEFHRQRPPGL